MQHSQRTYDADNELWQPNPRTDGGAGENLSIECVAACRQMLYVHGLQQINAPSKNSLAHTTWSQNWYVYARKRGPAVVLR